MPFTPWSGAGGSLFAPIVSPLTFGASIPVNAAAGNVFTVTLTASTGTFATPTNPTNGQQIQLRVTQDGVGGRTVAWAAGYDFGSTGGVANSAPPQTAVASKTDIYTFQYSSDLSLWCYLGAAIPQGF